MDSVYVVPLALFFIAFVLALIANSMSGWRKEGMAILCACCVIFSVVALFARVEPERVETALKPAEEK